MKQLIFSTIIIFAFCLTALAQENELVPRLEGDPVDRFGKISLNDYNARLDNFLVSITDNSKSKGVLVLKFDKKDSRSYKISKLKNIYKRIVSRKFDESLFWFIISESNFEESTFWIVPQGVDFPKIENSILIKSKELNRKTKDLFQKK